MSNTNTIHIIEAPYTTHHNTTHKEEQTNKNRSKTAIRESTTSQATKKQSDSLWRPQDELYMKGSKAKEDVVRMCTGQ